MKPGLRLQILFLLGALLVLGFVPLHFAVEAYLSAALTQSKREHNVEFGRALASHLAFAATEAPERLEERVRAEVGRGPVRAIAVFDASGPRAVVASSEEEKRLLPSSVEGSHEGMREVELSNGPGVLMTVPKPPFTVSTLLSRDEPRIGLLTRLLALYMVLIATLLLATAYFTLTRWIVTPVAQLSLAAQRVASTARHLETPETSSRELHDLSRSIQVMTERLLAEEDALRKQVKEVELATERLKATQAQLLRSERMASVGQLAAGLAHEVGNPIAAMMGLQDLILSGGLTPEEQADFIKRMRKETERIHRILRDLLDFARPTRAKDGPAPPGSVEVAINETTTLLLPQPVARNVELALDVYPDLPKVKLSHEQLVQVLLNLLLNAAQACQEGGTVQVTARPAGDRVVITVDDDGPGVPTELGERIFEPFVSSKEVGEGSGLGLSVCRGLVEASGGTVRLEPKEKGARFVIELPTTALPERAA